MLRYGIIGLFVISFGVAVVIAQRDPAKPNLNLAKADQPGVEVPPEAGNGRLAKPINPLPISQVVLFNSGVGYFHRSGNVEGDAHVDLQFQATDINDLIKSLVIEDPQGKVLPLRYDSQEPIEKTLRSFAINLSTNPSFGQILNQARGEKVELTLAATNTGLPGTLTGTIIGMESAHRLPTPTATATAEMEFVNLMCAEGLRTVPINQIQRLRFLNAALENELRRALEVVASGHDSQKKYVRLGFRGEGKREVKVGYVTENPIWKTSYRVVLDKDGKTKLLGWANVENTSDEDWHDIKLTLVSGRPISFQMDLYPPLFIPRPTVEPELFASLRPPTYSGPMTNTINFGQFGFQGGVGFGGFQGGFANNSIPIQQMPNMPPMSQQPMQMNQAVNPLGQAGGMMGMQGNFPGFNFNNPQNFSSQLGNRYQNNDNAGQPAQQKLTFKDLQNRRNLDNNNKQQQEQAKQIGSIITNVDPELIESALTAEQLGNPARFVIEEKVSLPRQQSAMLPILEQPIDATRVSIYNQRVQAKHPLFGLKIKNNSKQSLMQGPIAVYDEGQYAGDARILDLQPGEERFISYAIDIGTEVIPFDKVIPAPEMTARMENGHLQVQYKLRTTRTYLIKNRSPEARKVVIEQGVRDGWKFTEARKVVQLAPGKKDADGMEKEGTWKTGDVEKPVERTRDLYRFNVDVKSGETVKYEVSEELPRIDPFASSRQADWTGFATTLGLDVWTDSHRTPENAFGLEVVNNALKVTHKDRRTTTYFLRNRADVERTIWLEHFVNKDRHLVGNDKPAEDARRYRFKLVIPPGKTLTQTVVEEFKNAHPEMFGLKAGPPTYTQQQVIKPNAPTVPLPNAQPNPAEAPVVRAPVETNELPSDRFITELGFEVWQTRQAQPDTLMSARFIKGELYSSTQNREAVTYHIRNTTQGEKSFRIDHHVRLAWSFVGTQKPVEGMRQCYRMELNAATDETAHKIVTEERTVPRKETLAELNEDRIKALVSSAKIGDAVKDSIKKGTAMIQALAQTESQLNDLRAQFKEITEEQTRIKGNLEKLPVNSDLYKRLIGKFDTQETALERVQGQLTEKVALEKSQQKELAGFLEKLNVQ